MITRYCIRGVRLGKRTTATIEASNHNEAKRKAAPIVVRDSLTDDPQADRALNASRFAVIALAVWIATSIAA